MINEITEYLKTQKVGVLAVEMLDGSPHGATVHFAYKEDPFAFYFETYRDYRKSEALFGRDKTRATFVVGTDELTTCTFQLDGIVELIKPEEVSIYEEVYFSKFPKKKEKSKDPKFVTFKFTPKWWRFTDWKAKDGKLVLVSDTK